MNFTFARSISIEAKVLQPLSTIMFDKIKNLVLMFSRYVGEIRASMTRQENDIPYFSYSSYALNLEKTDSSVLLVACVNTTVGGLHSTQR